jgi:hypothetical protein
MFGELRLIKLFLSFKDVILIENEIIFLDLLGAKKNISRNIIINFKTLYIHTYIFIINTCMYIYYKYRINI